MAKNVGIVIVSHSPDVAKGAADMVRQMVGDSVPLAWTGGNQEGGLGTDVAAIIMKDFASVLGHKQALPPEAEIEKNDIPLHHEQAVH